LPGRLDVAAEDDEPAGLEFPEALGGFGVEFRAGNAGEEELAEEFGVGHGLRGDKEETESSGGRAGCNKEVREGAADESRPRRFTSEVGSSILTTLFEMKNLFAFSTVPSLCFQPWLRFGYVVCWCCLVMAGMPGGGAAQSVAVDEKAERYLDAYMMYNEGERIEKEGNLEEALRKYREASQVFDSLAKSQPGWETNMIAMRRRKVADSMARVQGVLQRAPSAGAPTAGGGGAVPSEVPGVVAPASGAMSVMPGIESKGPPEVGTWGGSGTGNTAGGSGDVPSLGAFLQEYEQQVKLKMEGLQRKNLEMEGALRKWDDWYRWASKEIQVARTEKESLAARAAEMEGRVKQMQREVDAGSATQGQLDTLLKEKVALLALEKTNNQRLASAEATAAEAAQKVTAVSAELNAVKVERDQLKTERDTAMKERDAAQVAERKLMAEVVELKKSRPDEEALKRLTAENGRLKGELEAAKLQVTALQEGLTKKDAEIEGLKKDLGMIQGQLAALQKENTTYQTQVSELTTQLKELQQGMAKADGGAGSEESAMLREVILRQLRTQARQQQAKALVIEEMKKMEGASAELLARVQELDAGRMTLTAEEEALFTDPQAQELLKSGSGAVKAKLMASGDASTVAAVDTKGVAPAGDSALAKLLEEGAQAVRSKDYAKAVTSYSEALRASPKDVDALLGLGDAYQRAGQFEEAEVTLKKCLDYDPDNAVACHVLGLTYFRANRLNDAMKAFEESLVRDGKQALAHHYLGIIASRLKQAGRAEKEFRTALAINPDFGEAHFNLAVLYIGWDPPQIDKARTEYQSAISKGVVPDENLQKLLKP
jgi:tetratricopeptide (TPR) repeat protein